MANRRKKAKRWHWTHSIMWWAFLISGVIHLGLVYLLPTIDFLPVDSRYIEIEDAWLSTLPDEAAIGERNAEPVDEGPAPASTPDFSTSWDIPPQTAALEPVAVTARRTDHAWEMALIGLNPDLSDTLAQPKQERALLAAPEDNLPPLTIKAPVSQTLSKPRLLPDDLESPAHEPEIRPETEVEAQAEQRFHETLFSDAAQPTPELRDPERRSANLPDMLETAQVPLPVAAAPSRPALIQPAELLASLSVIPSPTHEKSLPPVVVPEIPEREPLEHEELIAAAEPVLNFPDVSAQAVRPERSDDLPEPEIQPPEALAAQPTFLPQQQQIAAAPRPQSDPGTMAPIAPARPRPAVAIVPGKAKAVSLFERPRTQELALNDEAVRAVTPAPTQRPPQVSEAPTPPADAPRPITPQALTMPEQVPDIPVRRQSALSRTQRALILGAKDQVPTLPLEGPRFGIIVRKDDAIPEETLRPDPELRLDDTVQHTAQESAQRAEEFVIEGPAATRHVLFKPRQFPEIELDMDVTIRLKFWVLPDGTVGEVLPLQRGDVRLERAAIAYMKNWRFTAVSPDQPEVWGIIPITYTLR